MGEKIRQVPEVPPPFLSSAPLYQPVSIRSLPWNRLVVPKHSLRLAFLTPLGKLFKTNPKYLFWQRKSYSSYYFHIRCHLFQTAVPPLYSPIWALSFAVIDCESLEGRDQLISWWRRDSLGEDPGLWARQPQTALRLSTARAPRVSARLPRRADVRWDHAHPPLDSV